MSTPSLRTQLTPPELVSGVAYGLDASAPAAYRAAVDSPRQALAQVMRHALNHPPCVVSFSGGRDSSAILAVAVAVAREHGLDLPIPATLVFPGDAAADEEEWQRPVLDHLGLTTWERLVIKGDEVDAVGPIAREALSRHGLIWPFNAHFHVPIMRFARGGTVITGFGGDELGNASTSRRAARILQDRPRSVADLLVVAHAFAPRPVRRVVISGRFRRAPQLPWLTELGRREVVRMFAADEAAEPWRWDALLRQQFLRGRYFRICKEAFAALAGDCGVEVVHPFTAEPVVTSLADALGKVGAGSREQLMALLFGDLLPARTVSRATKGTFTSPLWTETARSFAREWSGRSPAPGLVDPDRLRAAWLEPRVDVRSTALLQAAWLGDHR